MPVWFPDPGKEEKGKGTAGGGMGETREEGRGNSERENVKAKEGGRAAKPRKPKQPKPKGRKKTADPGEEDQERRGSKGVEVDKSRSSKRRSRRSLSGSQTAARKKRRKVRREEEWWRPGRREEASRSVGRSRQRRVGGEEQDRRRARRSLDSGQGKEKPQDHVVTTSGLETLIEKLTADTRRRPRGGNVGGAGHPTLGVRGGGT